MSVKATVPPGVMSGMPFRVQVGASLYQVVCPPGAYPGMEIIVQVPTSTVPVAVPVGYQQPPPTHHRHRHHSQTPVPVQAMPMPMPPPPPPPQPVPMVAPRPPPRAATGPRVLCCKNHIVDENSPEMTEHNIKTMCTCVWVRARAHPRATRRRGRGGHSRGGRLGQWPALAVRRLCRIAI